MIVPAASWCLVLLLGAVTAMVVGHAIARGNAGRREPCLDAPTGPLTGTEAIPMRSIGRLQGVFLFSGIVLCAPAYSFHLTSFLLAKEAVLCVFICLCATTLLVEGRFSYRGYVAFMPLWVMLTATTTIHLIIAPAKAPSDAVVEVVRCMVLLLAAALAYDLLLQRDWRNRLLTAWLISVMAVAVLGILQYADALPFLFPKVEGYAQPVYSVFGNQDLFGGYVAMAVPILMYRVLRGPRQAARSLLGLCVLVPALLLSGSRSAWLAAAAGTLLTVPYRKLKLGNAAVLAVPMMVLAGATVLLAPQSTLDRLRKTGAPTDTGLRVRLWIWDGSFRMIADAPWIGIGPGNYAYWSPRYLGEALHAPGGERHLKNELHAGHAHCEPLEILAESGVLGLGLAVWMLVRLVRCRGPEWGGLAALLVFSLFNAPFHSAPHALGGLLLSGILLERGDAAARRKPRQGGDARLPAYVTAAACFAATAFFLWGVLLPSYWLRTAEDAHLAGRSPFGLYERVVRRPWPNATAESKYGIALEQAGRGEEAYCAFRRAQEAGLDTGEIHLALGVLAFEANHRAAAQEALEACVFRWPGNVFAWKLLWEAVPPSYRAAVAERAGRWIPSEALEPHRDRRTQNQR